jgi:hypothetical protein
MIWMHHDTIWVRDHTGCLTAFDAGRLAASIQRAAVAQGLPDWWLAEPLGLAVREYVSQNTDGDSFIDAEEMATVIASVLSKLGFPEIAHAYQHRQEHAQIRLDQLNIGMELDFYRELDLALHAASVCATRHLELTGLRSCVMRLRGASRWSKSCRQLAEEIVEHVRERVMRLRPAGADVLGLAVVE